MTLRTGHGNGAGVPRVEVLPAGELPVGVPEQAGPSGAAERGVDGRFLAGNRTSTKGGLRKAGSLALARSLGLADNAAPEMRPYLDHAERWRRAKVTELAATVGGGRCGAGPSSIIATAARQLASSTYLFELGSRTGDADLLAQSSRLGNDSRQNLLAAHELCAREATARPAKLGEDWWRK